MLEVIRKQIEKSYYWDARVKSLDCNYFCDEIKLIYENGEGEILYYFKGCYKIKVEHNMEYPKEVPYKELKTGQIPFFMQNVEVSQIEVNKEKYLNFLIDLYPIKMQIVCKDFCIY